MRMLVSAKIPHETFNAAVRDGSADKKMKAILDDAKPEAVYFTEMQGHRCALMIVDMEDSTQVPALAEPWFLTFSADVEFHVLMGPDDLLKAGLDALGKKWG
ncbi:panthothenate synthetase [Planctomycetota bacterium]